MNEKRYRAAEERFWEQCAARPTERWLELREPATRVRVQETGEGPLLVFFAPTPFVVALARQMASARVDVVPGAGHLPWFDDARDAAARIRAFVRDE